MPRRAASHCSYQLGWLLLSQANLILFFFMEIFLLAGGIYVPVKASKCQENSPGGKCCQLPWSLFC